MKALKYIGILLLTLIALFFILGLIAPKKSHVVRSITIASKPETVHKIVADFNEYNKWNPFLDQDPAAKVTIEGTPATEGSKYSWVSDKIGEGNQTITKIEANAVLSHLEFIKPMAGHADVALKFEPSGDSCKTTWTFDSESPFPFNAMNLIFSTEKMLGPEFEKGLKKLKEYAETKKPTTFRGYEIKTRESVTKYYAGIRKVVPFQDIASFIANSYQTIEKALTAAKINIAGSPAGLYYIYDEKTGTTDMLAGFPIASKSAIPGLEIVELPAGKELVIDFYGAMEKSGEAHYALDDYIKANGLKSNLPVIEEYISDPTVEKDTTKWLTKIVYPIQ